MMWIEIYAGTLHLSHAFRSYIRQLLADLPNGKARRIAREVTTAVLSGCYRARQKGAG